jgi:hypothetical protein
LMVTLLALERIGPPTTKGRGGARASALEAEDAVGAALDGSQELPHLCLLSLGYEY